MLASNSGGLSDSQDDQCEMCDKLGSPPSISREYTVTYRHTMNFIHTGSPALTLHLKMKN